MGTHATSKSCPRNGVVHSVNRIESCEDVYLYDPVILDDLDMSQCCATYQPQISLKSPGHGLKVRPLCLSDYNREYIQLLQQLTVVGTITREMFTKRFLAMKNCPNTYFVVVVEDETRDIVVGSVTLLIEQKFIRTTALRGRIEDVVVSKEYRGRQLGKLLVDIAFVLAQKIGVYKLSLDCKDPLVPFYQIFGLCAENNTNVLIKRFKD